MNDGDKKFWYTVLVGLMIGLFTWQTFGIIQTYLSSRLNPATLWIIMFVILAVMLGGFKKVLKKSVGG